jgi:signal transduction histidine kinase
VPTLVPGRPPGIRPPRVDVLLALVLALVGAASLWITDAYIDVPSRPPDLLGVLLVVGCTAPLAWRRSRPAVVLALVLVSAVALSALDYVEVVSPVALVVAVYSLATYGSRLQGVVGLLVTTATFLIGIALDPIRQTPVDFGAAAAVLFGAWAFGLSTGLRRAYTAEVEARATRLEDAREADVRAVVAEERNRIARELHDVVGHHLSVMTVQASAAQRTLARDPDRSREAMAAVEETGRSALTEMRRIVGVLRTEDEPTPDLGPPPGAADLDALVNGLREAGLDAELAVEGEPVPLPPGVALTVYRIVQEALTNTLKHAGPTRAVVLVGYRRGWLDLRITDEGRAYAVPHSGVNGVERDRDTDGRPGHGLLGMRERVVLYGGRLYAGPRRGGGYRVVARIPLEQHGT